MDALMYLDATLTALTALVLTLLTLIVTIVLLMRQRRLLNRYRLLLNGNAGQDLEQLLIAQASSLEHLQGDLGMLRQQVNTLETNALVHLQKTAIIRFNAFPDTGSDLSFAIALLDANQNGVVLSSLYGRSESRVYAKPIQQGKSTYQLSDEERDAIAKALGTHQR